jgi:PAS domain S-box-containing protein
VRPEVTASKSALPALASIWQGATISFEFLAAIIDHVAHPVFVKDRAFRWVLLNRSACDLVGYRRQDMLGKSDYDFFPKEEADFFRKKDVELFATKSEVVIDEEPITDASGRRHVLTTTKVPLRDQHGEVTHIVGIIHDITRLKEAESALRRANLEYEQRLEQRSRELIAAQDELVRKERLAVLGQLAGSVAHQIRNPLAAIKNAASVLKRSTGEEVVVAQMLSTIDDEVRHANQIVTDLLDYARVRPPTTRSIDVGYLIQTALDGQHVPPNISVTLNVPDLPPVQVDVDQVQMALANLVRNALDAMPDGGALTLSAELDDREVVVVIEDSGSGVKPEVQKRLFEPLVTTKPRGLGLGLTTARILLENQGGSVAYCERGGPGTRFKVRLPRGD